MPESKRKLALQRARLAKARRLDDDNIKEDLVSPLDQKDEAGSWHPGMPLTQREPNDSKEDMESTNEEEMELTDEKESKKDMNAFALLMSNRSRQSESTPRARYARSTQFTPRTLRRHAAKQSELKKAASQCHSLRTLWSKQAEKKEDQ